MSNIAETTGFWTLKFCIYNVKFFLVRFHMECPIYGRVIWFSRPLIWSKTLMEQIFNPCCEFRWSPEGPVSQIHSPHILVSVPGIYSDLLRSVQVIKREWGAKRNGKLPHLLIPSKTAAWIPEFAVEDLPSAELQPRFLRLQWRICLWAEHYDE